jgi:hypothetical protein
VITTSNLSPTWPPMRGSHSYNAKVSIEAA